MNDIYQRITDRILEQLHQGVIPWRKTWKCGLPASFTTGKEYRGINILLLSSAPFESRHWISYRAAKEQGGQVRKGEKATWIYFWHWRDAEELAELREKNAGREPAPFTCFPSAVFNLEQVDGLIPPVETESGQNAHSPLERADGVVSVMPNPPRIAHGQNKEPCYIGNLDEVRLPHLSQFESAAEYYAALFHELAHSTAQPYRLNRRPEPERSAQDRYAFEELIAEFGACFLMGFAGLENPTSDALSAAYIAEWSERFQRDKGMLVRAASAAQRAADYVRGKVVIGTRPVAEPTPDLATATGLPA